MDRVLVCGDTHGQLQDVMVIFEELGLPAPGNVYLFNGNIADRGHNATEVRAEAERALVVAKGGPFDAAAAAATATAATDPVPALVAKASNTNTHYAPSRPQIFLLLLAFKLARPSIVHINRGNHEQVTPLHRPPPRHARLHPHPCSHLRPAPSPPVPTPCSRLRPPATHTCAQRDLHERHFANGGGFAWETLST